jgi:hypothetical protein
MQQAAAQQICVDGTGDLGVSDVAVGHGGLLLEKAPVWAGCAAVACGCAAV